MDPKGHWTRKTFRTSEAFKKQTDDKTLFFSELSSEATRFAEAFNQQFKSATKSLEHIAKDWLVLLFSPGKKNCTSVSGFDQEVNSQALNHFLSDSTFDFWEWQQQIAKQIFKHLSKGRKKQPVSLIIDESSFLKKGNHSCGVIRQYAGTSGKVDNCQVGVFAALTNGIHHGLVQSKLYLPSDWTKDQKRMEKAHVPEYAQNYESKIEMCKEMVFNLRGQGVEFEWVNYDSFYGRDREMMVEFEKEGICFVADVPRNTMVYENINGEAQKVEEWAKTWTFRKITLRQVASGSLQTEAAMKKVWVKTDNQQHEWMSVWLLMRKDSQGKMHYALSNYKGNKLINLAQMHARRYWIEKSFREAKDSLGMDQYQIRSYPGWHRWMSLIMMAMLFIISQALIPDPDCKKLTFEATVKFAMLFLFGNPKLFEKQLFQWYLDNPHKMKLLEENFNEPNLTK